MSKNNVMIKRIYEEAGPGDGMRVLVDRLWPRGIKKEDGIGIVCTGMIIRQLLSYWDECVSMCSSVAHEATENERGG